HRGQVEERQVRLAHDLARGPLGDDAELGLRAGERRLHVQPALEARRLGEERAHAGIVDSEGGGLLEHGRFSRTAGGALSNAAGRARGSTAGLAARAGPGAGRLPGRGATAARVPRDRRAEVFRLDPPRRRADWALRRVRFDALPLAGARRPTPARRALESPMAIACLVDRAPCLPARM